MTGASPEFAAYYHGSTISVVQYGARQSGIREFMCSQLKSFVERCRESSMRVVSGKFRSRPLRSLRGLDIRPTSDRLRETLFDVLTAGNPTALAGSVWLDLFAGTGAVGIEALSRGAERAYFVESSRHAADLIDANLHSLQITDGFQVLQQKAAHAINQLEELGVKPNFIFLDPPYQMREVYGETLARLGDSSMAREALTIAEHEKRFDLAPEFGILRRIRRLDQGDAALSFYKVSQ